MKEARKEVERIYNEFLQQQPTAFIYEGRNIIIPTYIREETAKYNSIICVNEILESLGKPVMQSYEEFEEHHDYWQSVLTELNKM